MANGFFSGTEGAWFQDACPFGFIAPLLPWCPRQDHSLFDFWDARPTGVDVSQPRTCGVLPCCAQTWADLAGGGVKLVDFSGLWCLEPHAGFKPANYVEWSE